MSNLSSDQLRELANFLDKTVNLINDYQVKNFNRISGMDHVIINNRETEIMIQANRLRTEAIIVSIENSSEILKEISAIVESIEETINNIETTSKIINVATSVVALALSIIGGDVETIGTSIKDIVKILDNSEE